MVHYCRICGKARPNESFSGKGHQIHICNDCGKMSEAERDTIEQEEEIFCFLKQSHISDKNIARLRALSTSGDSRIVDLALLVIEVAKVKPHKKRRLKVLAKERRDLLEALERTGLIRAHHW